MAEVKFGKSSQTNLPKGNNKSHANPLLSSLPVKPKPIQISNSEPRVDLNLGLSLGGVYSEEFKEKPIARSSSVAGMLTGQGSAHNSNSARPDVLSVTRSSSLPVESDQRHVRLRDWQAKKRRDSQKRLLEKRRRCRATPEEQKFSTDGAIVPMAPSQLPQVPAWVVTSAQQSTELSSAVGRMKTEAYVSGKQKPEEMGATGFQSLPNLNQQVNGPTVIPGAQEAGKAVQPSDIKVKDPPQQVKVANHSYEAIGMEVMKNMPSVSTIGDGPNGRRIEGVLYQYLKGQVSIVCVCHGSFLTPAEFVKHAGGKEVDNPMRRISVWPTF